MMRESESTSRHIIASDKEIGQRTWESWYEDEGGFRFNNFSDFKHPVENQWRLSPGVMLEGRDNQDGNVLEVPYVIRKLQDLLMLISVLEAIRPRDPRTQELQISTMAGMVRRSRGVILL